jgi:hypothetical protein
VLPVVGLGFRSIPLVPHCSILYPGSRPPIDLAAQRRALTQRRPLAARDLRGDRGWDGNEGGADKQGRAEDEGWSPVWLLLVAASSA